MGSVEQSSRHHLKLGMAVEWWSIAWMAVEALVSLVAGYVAGSVALFAFGADSIVEILSATVVLHRLAAEFGGADPERVERSERIASGITGGLLLLLSLWVAVSAGRDLITRTQPETSALGIAVAALASLIMPVLWRTKRRVAANIHSAALRADAACSMVCGYMSFTLLAGLALRAAFGWWWADPLASLGLLYFIAREGWEAIEVARGRSDECCRT